MQSLSGTFPANHRYQAYSHPATNAGKYRMTGGGRMMNFECLPDLGLSRAGVSDE